MKRQHWSIGLAIVLAGSLVATASADDKKAAEKKKQEEAYAKYAKPGKPHQHFKRLVGRWNAEILNYEDPSGKPTKNKGTSNIRLLLGGRFMQHNFRGSFGGKPFQGIGITGYDNAQRKYVGTWMDNMGTGMMTIEGKYDAKSNTLTEMGTAIVPGGKMQFKMVSKYLSNDKYTFTMSMVSKEGERKMMEITYTRVPKKGGKKGKKRKPKDK